MCSENPLLVLHVVWTRYDLLNTIWLGLKYM